MIYICNSSKELQRVSKRKGGGEGVGGESVEGRMIKDSVRALESLPRQISLHTSQVIFRVNACLCLLQCNREVLRKEISNSERELPGRCTKVMKGV